MIKFNTEEEFIKALPTLNKNSTKVFEDFYLPVKTVISIVRKGLMLDNAKNRVDSFGGKMKVKQKHVERIAADLFAPALGMFSVESQGDGTVQCDAQHRKHAIILAYEQHVNPTVLDNHPILVRVVRKGLGGLMNGTINSMIAHGTRVRLLSDDYEYGRLLTATLSNVPGFRELGTKTNSFLQPIANGMYVIGMNKIDMPYIKFYNSKVSVKELQNISRGERLPFVWRKKQKDTLIAAISAVLYMLSCMEEEWEENNQMTEDLASVLKSSQFFAFLLHDAISTKKVIIRSFDIKMIERIRKKGGSFKKALSGLSQFHKDNIPLVYRILGIIDKEKTVRRKSDAYKVFENSISYIQ